MDNIENVSTETFVAAALELLWTARQQLPPCTEGFKELAWRLHSCPDAEFIHAAGISADGQSLAKMAMGMKDQLMDAAAVLQFLAKSIARREAALAMRLTDQAASQPAN